MEETTVSEKSCSWKDLGLSPVLCETCEKLGFTKPTNIQLEAIPWALKGRDVIGLAQTGSGKTASFVLPILDGLLTGGSERRVGNAPFALILAPTRELAVQIQEQVEALGSDIGIKSACLVGGMDMVSQAIVLARRPHIVIGTPGRLVDHLQNTKGFSIRGCRFLVLDEADRLLTMDFEEEIDRILAALGNTNTSSNSAAEGETNNASSKTTKRRQTMLFSATMTSKVAKLQRASLCDPVRIQVSSSKYSTVETLLQSYMFVPSKFKDCYLVYLANELSANSIIIFVTTCMGAQRLALLLRNLGFQAIPLHGQMSQPKRLGSLNQFKSGERSILIATDVASRGLDIPHVDVVINYDIPNHSKDYIHRVGRTARAGRSGKSITMVTQYDVELYQRIETLIGRKMDPYPANKDAVMLLHDRVSESQRLATLAIRDDPSMQKLKKRSLNDDNESDPKSLITKHAKKIKKNHR